MKPDYTEDARLRRLEGEVVMEIVVRRDGVRQWRFSPARRLASPVDVIVEVSVEFKLR